MWQNVLLYDAVMKQGFEVCQYHIISADYILNHMFCEYDYDHCSSFEYHRIINLFLIYFCCLRKIIILAVFFL